MKPTDKSTRSPSHRATARSLREAKHLQHAQIERQVRKLLVLLGEEWLPLGDERLYWPGGLKFQLKLFLQTFERERSQQEDKTEPTTSKNSNKKKVK